MLVNDEGMVRASMRFCIDTDHRISVVGKLDADIMVMCQRCLVAFKSLIKSDFSLTFVATEGMIDELPDDLDPVLLDEKGQIHVVDLFEDELILQVPVVPRHEKLDDCSANGYENNYFEFDEAMPVQEQIVTSQPGKKNPFQILRGIKKK